jgi:hypothetical protein
MIGSKFMALLSRYSSLADQTSSLPSIDSIATARKQASAKSFENSRSIQRVDQKLRPF